MLKLGQAAIQSVCQLHSNFPRRGSQEAAFFVGILSLHAAVRLIAQFRFIADREVKATRSRSDERDETERRRIGSTVETLSWTRQLGAVNGELVLGMRAPFERAGAYPRVQ